MTIIDKNTTSFAVYKSIKKASVSQRESVLYLHYRRAQVKDEGCLATSDPTTSMFLYWINTNRMGTAKKTILQCFYIKKTFFKKIHELVHNWKRARQTFQSISDTVAIYLYCPGKRTAQKFIALKYATFLGTTFSEQHV